MSTVTFTVNGSSTQVDRSARRLSDVLRDHLALTATKVGCDAGDCGACTVLLDGEPVTACMTSVGRLEGRQVETLEGLHESGEATPLQGAFLAHGAAQCGICTPGMLVSAAALLRATSTPTEQQVMDALGGVLCRCTGYRKIVAAVMAAQVGATEHRAVAAAGRQGGGSPRPAGRRPTQGQRHRRVRRRRGARGSAHDPHRPLSPPPGELPARRHRRLRRGDARRRGGADRRRHRWQQPVRRDPRHGRSARVRRGTRPFPGRSGGHDRGRTRPDGGVGPFHVPGDVAGVAAAHVHR